MEAGFWEGVLGGECCDLFDAHVCRLAELAPPVSYGNAHLFRLGQEQLTLGQRRIPTVIPSVYYSRD